MTIRALTAILAAVVGGHLLTLGVLELHRGRVLFGGTDPLGVGLCVLGAVLVVAAWPVARRSRVAGGLAGGLGVLIAAAVVGENLLRYGPAGLLVAYGGAVLPALLRVAGIVHAVRGHDPSVAAGVDGRHDGRASMTPVSSGSRPQSTPEN